MRVLLQRVTRASVKVDGRVVGEIGKGILLLVGVHQQDRREEATVLAARCAELRIFPDAEGKMNLSCKDVGGGGLVVSQFTLYGDCRRGRRPNFMEAAGAEKGRELYERFLEEMRLHLPQVEAGVFGAMMEVELVNNGPVTLLLERLSV